jgi:cell wall-associated NlpC family hydrolase
MDKNVVICLAVVATILLLAGLALAVAPSAKAQPAGPAKAQPAKAQPASTRATRPTEYVDVSVATVWTSPSSPRRIDAPALSNPVNIPHWLAGLTPAQKNWLISHNATQTQALYGQQVDIIGQRGSWDEVAVPGQPTPKNPLGYPGWVPKAQLVAAPGFARQLKNQPFALVNQVKTAWLYDNSGSSGKFIQVSFGSRLPVLKRTASADLVATPADGPKWLKAADATVYAARIPVPTGADLVATAKMFLGVPYLWAGRSGYAFDCSGFTSALYQSYGITIPRDADAQALDGGGALVAKSQLRPGDILFYANAGGIYHDALYIGGGRVIEAGLSDGKTPPITTSSSIFGPDYWGAIQFISS